MKQLLSILSSVMGCLTMGKTDALQLILKMETIKLIHRILVRNKIVHRKCIVTFDIWSRLITSTSFLSSEEDSSPVIHSPQENHSWV